MSLSHDTYMSKYEVPPPHHKIYIKANTPKCICKLHLLLVKFIIEIITEDFTFAINEFVSFILESAVQECEYEKDDEEIRLTVHIFMNSIFELAIRESLYDERSGICEILAKENATKRTNLDQETAYEKERNIFFKRIRDDEYARLIKAVTKHSVSRDLQIPKVKRNEDIRVKLLG